MSTLPLKFHSTNALRGTKELPNHKNGQRRIVSFSSQKSLRSSAAFSNENLKNDSWGDEDFTKRDNLTLRSRTMSSGHQSRTASSNEIRFGIDRSLSLRRRYTSIQDNPLDDMQPASDYAQPPATEKPRREKHELRRSTLGLDTEEIKLALQKIQKENPFSYIALHRYEYEQKTKLES